MTVIRTDNIFIPKPTIHVSTIRSSSSDSSIVSMLDVICAMTDVASIAEDEWITPDAELTICCPTSNTAIVISNVFDRIHTAIHIFTKYTKNSQNSMSFP